MRLADFSGFDESGITKKWIAQEYLYAKMENFTQQEYQQDRERFINHQKDT